MNRLGPDEAVKVARRDGFDRRSALGDGGVQAPGRIWCCEQALDVPLRVVEGRLDGMDAEERRIFAVSLVYIFRASLLAWRLSVFGHVSSIQSEKVSRNRGLAPGIAVARASASQLLSRRIQS